MPITRRKRANPPDQPEDNNNHVTEPAVQGAEPTAAEPAPSTPAESGPPPAPALPERVDIVPPTPTRFANPSMANGDRADRSEYAREVNSSAARRSRRLCLCSQ